MSGTRPATRGTCHAVSRRPKSPLTTQSRPTKVDLGRRLFYDTRLSGNGRYACASCHQQARAFTDGRAHALGSTGGVHPRSTMSLANVAYNVTYGWADPSLRSLEAQMAVPMFNEHPIEMGMKGREPEIAARLAADRRLAALVQRRLSWRLACRSAFRTR